MKTKDSLGIYWTFSVDGDRYQDEVSGLIFYGYWKKNFSEDVVNNLDGFVKIWADSEIEVKSRLWEGAENCNFSIEVRIDRWPEKDWMTCVKESLKWFSNQGAEIAWCGGEYSGPSLNVFDPEDTSGGIYAAYTCHTGFVCKSGLNEEYIELGEREITNLKNAIE
jgi:hypothetical protein